MKSIVKITRGEVKPCVKNGKKQYKAVNYIHFSDGTSKDQTSYGLTAKEAYEKATTKYYTAACAARMVSDGDVPFSIYCNYWLHGPYKDSVKDNTWRRMEQVARLQAIPFFGDKRLKDITRADVQDFLAHFAKEEHKYNTVKKYKDIIRLMFDRFMDEYPTWVYRNPADGVKMPECVPSPKGTRERCFTKEEIAAIFNAALAIYKNGKPVYRLGLSFIFMVLTGIRPSEMLGLHWKSVAKDFSQIKIEAVAVLDEKGKTIIDYRTKTRSSRRTIILSDAAKNVLRQLYDITGEEIFVMSTKEHTHVQYPDFNRTFHCILKRAGIEVDKDMYIGAHSFRHTFATLMAEKDISPKVLATIMGHHSVVCTYDHYVHPSEKRLAEAMETLADFIVPTDDTLDDVADEDIPDYFSPKDKDEE